MRMEVVRVAHISDLHFDKQKKNHCTWPRLVDQLRNHIGPDLLLVTGDIADTTSQRLYQEAKMRSTSCATTFAPTSCAPETTTDIRVATRHSRRARAVCADG